MGETTSTPTERKGGLRYAYFVVAMLMAAYLLSLLDRVVLGMLAEPIRAELDLSDTQLGLLLGFGFVLFYSGLGIPLGALADAYNRRNLIVGGILVWSLATAATGFAGGFMGIMLARTLVGAGEATLSPSALSMIGDRFERHHLGIAVSIFSLGGSIGIGAAMALGGLLTDWSQDLVIRLPFVVLEGWRVVMFLIGMAGLPFALLLLLTVREPPRRRPEGFSQGASMADVFKYIRDHPGAFAGLLLGFGAMVSVTYLPMLWAPAHFARFHDMGPRELAAPLGAIFGIAGGGGLLLGGLLSDRLSRRRLHDGTVRILLWSLPLQAPCALLAFTTPDKTLALCALAAQLFFGSLYGGLQGVTVQLMTPPTMHGRMMAIYLLVVTVIGMGFGPLVVGAISENVFDGPGGLGRATATTMIGALAICATILLAARPAMKRLMESRVNGTA